MEKVVVLGLGKVGTLVALLLKECGFKVLGIDAIARDNAPVPMEAGDVTDKDFLQKIFSENDAVISCLPYHLNMKVAKSAYNTGIHYFDLTEDVPTTNFIRKLSGESKGIMAPQCGLAPGFIGIVGSNLTKEYDRLRSIELRVGALPQHPKGDLGYAFNWSPEGVVNEYLNDCEVIADGHVKMVPAMQELETIMINGCKLEAFTTSGGLGTMCETFGERVETLNYKTMRYPGHMRLMRFFFHELMLKKDREDAGKILVNAKPPVNDDVVYIHAAVEGWKSKKTGVETLARDEFVRAYYPREFAGTEWRAISWTTASSVVAIVEMVAAGTLPNTGFLKQEDIPLDAFFNTRFGKEYGK
jgi:saccharopine dehydrogenase (NAD+, L-lysine-forming)